MNQKNNSALLRSAIITMSLVQMATNGIAPILEEIAKSFPHASPTSIQFLMTFPSIFVVVMCLLSSFIVRKFSHKSVAVSGLILVCISGILAFLFHGNLTLLFVWAAILGIGVGLVSPIAPSLISSRFEGQSRQTMLGIQNSSSSVGSMLMTFLCGLIAVLGWNYGYLVYLIAVPGILLTILGVKENNTSTTEDRQSNKNASNAPFHFAVGKEMVIAFFFLMLFSSIPANLAMLVAEKNIGGAALAGTMSTLFLLGGTLAGFIFGLVVSKLKNLTVSFGCLLLVIGAIIIYLSPNAILLAIGCFIGGTSISMVMPNCMGGAAKMPGYETLASALVLSSSNIGVFVAPVITSITAAITGSSATSYRFITVAIIAALLSCAALIMNKKRSA